MATTTTTLLRLPLLLVLLFHVFSAAAKSYRTVNSLPGFSGPLPFELETGYVVVGNSEEFELFYYFVKSYENPLTDPLLLWLTGGPRCSAFCGLAFEAGPIIFGGEASNGTLPEVLLNPYSWTKKASIIFLDLPVGTGFSYATTSEIPKPGDSMQVHHAIQFLRKWMDGHPEYISNPFFVAGNSYSGMIVPVVAHEILEGHKHIFPFLNFQGYVLGNPVTVPHSLENFRIPFAHGMALISNELSESLKASCQGEYVNIDPNNVECLRHYATYKECTSKVRPGFILGPRCSSSVQQDILGRRSLYSTSISPRCPDYEYLLATKWLNNDRVRKALHIHEGSVGEWVRCKDNEYYDYEFNTAFPYHVSLSSKGYRSLIYSGDHDMKVPYLETQAWIKSLNYSIIEDWRPWFIEDDVAGYTRSYANKMTFVTIKGGGHTPQYTRKECNILFNRWIAGESL